MEQNHELLLFAIENPLIDISKEFDTEDIINRYGLTHGLASLAGEAQMPLYDELWLMEGIETIPGGSGLNTTRAVNFMLKNTHPDKCAYAGCIGNDDRGKTLMREVEKSGVKGYFHIDENTPTGTCAVIIHKLERTLVANLAACLKYPTEHLY